MKTGRTIQELAIEIQRQLETKKDYKADTRKIKFVGNNTVLLEDVGEFGITEFCHQQMATFMGIPKIYYDRMKREAPDLLIHNANHWLDSKPDIRLVRTLDGDVRAFLSDKYRILDNFDMMEAVFPIVLESRCELVSCDVTPSRLYLKALLPDVKKDVKPGDEVQAGICISNSEVGDGSLRVEPLVYRLVCKNGMMGFQATRKYHVGRGGGKDNYQDIQMILRDETRIASDRAFWMQMQDVVRSAFDVKIFEKNVALLTEATEQPIEGDPIKVVEQVQKNYGLSLDQKNSAHQSLKKNLQCLPQQSNPLQYLTVAKKLSIQSYH